MNTYRLKQSMQRRRITYTGITAFLCKTYSSCLIINYRLSRFQSCLSRKNMSIFDEYIVAREFTSIQLRNDRHLNNRPKGPPSLPGFGWTTGLGTVPGSPRFFLTCQKAHHGPRFRDTHMDHNPCAAHQYESANRHFHLAGKAARTKTGPENP